MCVRVEIVDGNRVPRLERTLVKDARLLRVHKERRPLPALHGVQVDKLAIVQPVVVGAIANVVVDELGRLEKAQHRKVIGRRLRGRVLRGGGRAGIELGEIVVGVAVARRWHRVGAVPIVQPLAQVHLDQLDLVAVLAHAQARAHVAPKGNGVGAGDRVGQHAPAVRHARAAKAVQPPVRLVSQVGLRERIGAQQQRLPRDGILLPSRDQVRRLRAIGIGAHVATDSVALSVDPHLTQGCEGTAAREHGVRAVEHGSGHDARGAGAHGQVGPAGHARSFIAHRILEKA